MLSAWLWLTAVAIQSVWGTDLSTCSRKWVKMNDQNYKKAIRHYAECVLLGQALDPPVRQTYQANIVMNLKKSCNYFFDRSYLPTSNLIGVVREVAKILEGFDEDLVAKEPKGYSKKIAGCCEPVPPTQPPCRTKQTTCKPEVLTTCHPITKNRGEAGSCLLLLLIIFLLLFALQLLFLVWFCCCNNCIWLQLCRSDSGCICEDDCIDPADQQAYDTYFLKQTQHDLTSLSSENVGSDSEFETLLKMKKLPKGANKPFHSKEVD